MRVLGLGVLLYALFASLCGLPLRAQQNRATPGKKAKPGSPVEIPLATATRLEAVRNFWWPTKTPQSHDGFIGNAACVPCHAAKVATQARTPMAQASRPAGISRILREHPDLTGKRGPYTYRVSQTPEGPTLSVSDGKSELSRNILWAFGAGNKGQTYVCLHDGAYFESEMSFYSSLGGLDVTTAHESHQRPDLAEALGMRMEPASAQKCFACHTTTATTASDGLAPEKAVPGIDCEACHGPGAAHAELMVQMEGETPSGDLRILNPRSLSPIASVDFCGACHRTWADVYELDVHGPVNARFQPYRLENSKCWGDGDARLTCVACHDPHQQLVHDTASYDSKCLACHSNAGGRAAAATPRRVGNPCPVAKRNCAGCHMPKITVPVMHSAFTDHRIRVVRRGERYPD